MKSRKAGLKKARPKSSKDSTFQPFPVTSPKYSGAWMDEVETRGTLNALERARVRLAAQSPPKSALQRHHRPTEKGDTMKADLHDTLEYVVEQLNKPEALAKYRTEAAMGRAFLLATASRQISICRAPWHGCPDWALLYERVLKIDATASCI